MAEPNPPHSVAVATNPPPPLSAASALSSSSNASSSMSNTVAPLLEPPEGDTVETDSLVLFWRGAWGSQWTLSPFTVDGQRYDNAEQWMMAGKARLFGDEAVLAKLLPPGLNPRTIKSLGRKVAGFDESIWARERLAIVVAGNEAKFRAHPLFARRLLQTGEKRLVEASPLDCVWGIGLAPEDADARDETKWRGLNLLGEALMQVRDKLRREEAEAAAAASSS